MRAVSFFLIFLLLFGFTDAQELPKTDIPFEVYDENKVEEEYENGIYSKATYDIYGRNIIVEQVFPFGYFAITEYDWYFETFLVDDKYYESRIKEERGYLLKNDKKSAEYVKKYDKNGELIQKDVSGIGFIRIAFGLLAPILGLSGSVEEDL